jgi:CRP-like cAMP-binding protein
MNPSTALAEGCAPLLPMPPRRSAAEQWQVPIASELSAAAAWAGLLPGAPLTADDLALLAALAQQRPVVAGELVLSRGVTAHRLVALWRGDAALGLRSSDGSFHTERLVRGPAWLDLGAAWLGAGHAADVRALSAGTVLSLPCAALAARLPAHPELAQRLIGALAAQVQALSDNTHELMHKDAPARLAHWLHQRLEPATDAAPRPAGSAPCQAQVRLHERKRDVAAQLAITPETLSRLMRSLVRQGVIEVAGYTVRVLDTAALSRIAAG